MVKNGKPDFVKKGKKKVRTIVGKMVDGYIFKHWQYIKWFFKRYRSTASKIHPKWNGRKKVGLALVGELMPNVIEYVWYDFRPKLVQTSLGLISSVSKSTKTLLLAYMPSHTLDDMSVYLHKMFCSNRMDTNPHRLSTHGSITFPEHP